MNGFLVRFYEPTSPVSWITRTGGYVTTRVDRHYVGYRGGLGVSIQREKEMRYTRIALHLSYDQDRRQPLTLSGVLSDDHLSRSNDSLGQIAHLINSLLIQFASTVAADERDVCLLLIHHVVDHLQAIVTAIVRNITGNVIDDALAVRPVEVPSRLHCLTSRVSILEPTLASASNDYYRTRRIEVIEAQAVHPHNFSGGTLTFTEDQPELQTYRTHPNVYDDYISNYGTTHDNSENKKAESLLEACFPGSLFTRIVDVTSKINSQVRYRVALSFPEKVAVYHNQEYIGYLCLDVGNGVCAIDRVIQRMLLARDQEKVLWHDAFFHPISKNMSKDLVELMGGRYYYNPSLSDDILRLRVQARQLMEGPGEHLVYRPYAAEWNPPVGVLANMVSL